MTVRVYAADITCLRVNVIVNAANEQLLNYGSGWSDRAGRWRTAPRGLQAAR